MTNSAMKTAVLFYLQDHYGITENRGIDLIADSYELVADAVRWSSRPYYPADQIAARVGLAHNDPCAKCAEESGLE